MNQKHHSPQKRTTLQRIILVLLGFSLTLSYPPETVQAQWTDNGSSLTTDDNVGIGTTTPGAKLHVTGNIDTTDGADRKLTLRSSTSYNYALQATGDDFQIIEAPGSSGAVRLHIDFPTGNIGIGATEPLAKLHVEGGNLLIRSLSNPMLRFGHDDATIYASIYRESSTGKFFIRNDQGQSIILDNGNVGIGTTAPDSTAKLHVAGDVRVDGNIAAPYQDLAEWVPTSKAILSGTVVVLDTAHSNQVLPSSGAYDTRVAGVVSDKPGILLGEAGEGRVKVATTGRVKVKVDATKKPVQVGDLLVTSEKEGVAMKSEPMEINGRSFHQPGTILGKALEPLKEGEGEILVLLSLQ